MEVFTLKKSMKKINVKVHDEKVFQTPQKCIYSVLMRKLMKALLDRN